MRRARDLEIVGDRAEGIVETDADQCKRCDPRHRNQRSDQPLLDGRDAALVFDKPEDSPAFGAIALGLAQQYHRATHIRLR
jgi:hypothetical protein